MESFRFYTKEDYTVKTGEITPLVEEEPFIVWNAASIKGVIEPPEEGEEISFGEWNEDDIRSRSGFSSKVYPSLPNQDAKDACEKLRELIYSIETSEGEPVNLLADFMLSLLKSIDFADDIKIDNLEDYTNAYVPTKDGDLIVFVIGEEGSLLENRRWMVKKVESMNLDKAPFTNYSILVTGDTFTFVKVIYSDTTDFRRTRTIVYPAFHEDDDDEADLKFCDPENRKVIIQGLRGLRQLVKIT